MKRWVQEYTEEVDGQLLTRVIVYQSQPKTFSYLIFV